VSLAAVATSAGPASAWFNCCGCYKSCFCYSVNVRPYNAFSPCCFGQVYCDGCAPPQYPLPACLNYGPYPCPGAGCAPGGAPHDGAMAGAPMYHGPMDAQHAYGMQAPYGMQTPYGMGMIQAPMGQGNPYMQGPAPGYPPAIPTSRGPGGGF
jgi:hypothetical protein